jgi:plastocyanin
MQRFEEVEMKALRILTVTLVAFLAALGFAACGGDGDGDNNATTAETTTQPAETTGGGTTSTSSVKMDEYSFDPDTVVAKQGDTITVENGGAIAHNLTVEQGPDPKKKSKKLAGTSTFLPNKSEKLKVDIKPGKYVMVCTVAGHRELGMVGTFTVK